MVNRFHALLSIVFLSPIFLTLSQDFFEESFSVLFTQ